MDKEINIKYLLDDKDAMDLSFAYENPAGMDIKLIKKVENKDHNVGEIIRYDTGIIFDIPVGYYLELHERSSFYKTGYKLANNVGIIDSDYRGHIYVTLCRFKYIEQYNDLINSTKGEGLQLILKKKYKYNLLKMNNINELSKTDRGDKGFGSSTAK